MESTLFGGASKAIVPTTSAINVTPLSKTAEINEVRGIFQEAFHLDLALRNGATAARLANPQKASTQPRLSEPKKLKTSVAAVRRSPQITAASRKLRRQSFTLTRPCKLKKMPIKHRSGKATEIIGFGFNVLAVRFPVLVREDVLSRMLYL